MIYALQEFISAGTIANKTDYLNYDKIAEIRSKAIQYYEKNGDKQYSLGELENVLSIVSNPINDKYAKGGIIKINDNITIKDNKVMVNGNNGFVNSGTINEWFENSPKVVKEVLNDKDENGEILFTRIAESDNFIYYTMDIKDFNTPNYKLDSIENDYPLIQYEAVHKPSGRSDYWGHWNGWGFMPLQDEFKYGKLNYQHPSLKKLMEQDSYYKSRKNFATGGDIENEQVYIDYMNKEKGFKRDRIYFNSYAEAVEWGKKNFERFNTDMINYLEGKSKFNDGGRVDNLYRRGAMAKGGGVETFWGGIRGKLRIPMLSFEKVDYNVNVERKGTNNYEIDVNITKNDSVDSRKLYDVAEEVSQENWGYLIQVVSFEQLYETLKVLRVRVSKDKLFSWFNGKRYEDGGSVDEQTYIDLFEDYENIPAEVQMILDEYSESFEDGDYIGMSKAQNELEQIGYTFDFYVDGDAYGLRPINVKLSQIQGYEDEDEE